MWLAMLKTLILLLVALLALVLPFAPDFVRRWPDGLRRR